MSARETAEAAVATMYGRGVLAKLMALDDQLGAQLADIGPQLAAIRDQLAAMRHELDDLSCGDGWLAECIEAHLHRPVFDEAELRSWWTLV